MSVSVLWIFITVPWVGLRCVIVVLLLLLYLRASPLIYSGHTSVDFKYWLVYNKRFSAGDNYIHLYPGIQFRLPCTPPGQFFMGAKLFIGTPWMGNEGVLKKNLVWAM